MRTRMFVTSWALLLTCGLSASSAWAHFPWMEIENRNSEKPTLQVYFSESPTPDNPALLQRLEGAQVWIMTGRRDQARKIELQLTDENLELPLDARQAESVFLMSKSLGVRTRGESSFVLNYYAKTGPAPTSWAWRSEKTGELLGLDVKPQQEDDQLIVTVLFNNKPVAGAEVGFLRDHALLDEVPVTNDKGQVKFSLSDKPIHALWVKFVEEKSGEQAGEKFDEIRHYTTVTFPPTSYSALKTSQPLADIPETVTSFGAAVAGGRLYYYGGHTGSAHSYSAEGQSNSLWSIDLKNGGEWKNHGQGPRLQGLALVADAGKLYRLGGFTAKNAEGEKHDLWSSDSFASYDPATGKWTDLPPLPERRSSFDAAVLDHKIYVIGGWSMGEEEQNQWHTTAWVFDLKADQPEWTALPSPPFQRRALSVAAYNGKIYAIGGMQSDGNVTTNTTIYDPAEKTWTAGPSLIGSGMTGFGTSSFATGGTLYVSTYDGTLQKLSADGKQWEMLGNLENARFFHRMVPVDDNRLVFLGGSNMRIGKFEEVEILELTK